MTIKQLKQAMAAYLDLTNGVADLSVNGLDLGLMALNQVRKEAELANDFEFSRRLLSLTVNGVTGGSLDAAVLYGTATTAEIKTIVDVGQFDNDGNLIPVEWTTVAESIERQRMEDRFTIPRYPSDGWAESGPIGTSRFAFTGSSVYRFPKDESNNFTLGLEAYTFWSDWTSDTETDVWTTHGSRFLQFAGIVQLNQMFREFVPRQEGNLGPPTREAALALDAFVQWDRFRFEQSRRHAR